nr:carboxypeptidase-like regulatory domain-containing protein [Bacteroidota bacterium]
MNRNHSNFNISKCIEILKRFALISICILLYNIVSAQETGIFKGKVLNDDSGESLIGATIKIQKNPNLGTAADRQGNFTLEIPAGSYKFIVSYTGMQSDTISEIITSGKTIERTIRLKVYASRLSEVEVKVGRLNQNLEKLTVSMEVIQLKQIENKNITHIETILDDT